MDHGKVVRGKQCVPGNSAESGTHISRFSRSLLSSFSEVLIFDSAH